MKIESLYLIDEGIYNKIPGFIQYYYDGKNTPENEKEIKELSEIDPTDSKKYSHWIIDNYKKGNIRVPEDNEKINELLKRYNQYGGNKPKIQELSPATLYRLMNNIDNPDKDIIKYGKLPQALPEDAMLIASAPYKVIKATSAEAASKLSQGTNWCVGDRKTAENYLNSGPLYFVYQDDTRIALLHYGSMQFMNPNDEPLDEKLKWDILDTIAPYTGMSRINNEDLAKEYQERIERYITNIIENPHEAHAWPEVELEIQHNPGWAYEYARNVIGDRWFEAEKYILEDPFYAAYYASEIIKDRWPKSEPIIMKDAEASLHYAMDVIKGRWLEAEPVMMTDPEIAVQYADNVIGGRWPKAEPYILTDIKNAYWYAVHVINGRWPELEAIIMRNPKMRDKYINAMQHHSMSNA